MFQGFPETVINTDNIFVKRKSKPPENIPTIAEIARTIKVNLKISSLFGQVTLVSSSLTSEKYARIFFTRGYCSRETIQKKELDLQGLVQLGGNERNKG